MIYIFNILVLSSSEMADSRLLNLKQELMENLVGLGTQEIERVMVLAVTNKPFDLDEAIIEKS